MLGLHILNINIFEMWMWFFVAFIKSSLGRNEYIHIMIYISCKFNTWKLAMHDRLFTLNLKYSHWIYPANGNNE